MSIQSIESQSPLNSVEPDEHSSEGTQQKRRGTGLLREVPRAETSADSAEEDPRQLGTEFANAILNAANITGEVLKDMIPSDKL